MILIHPDSRHLLQFKDRAPLDTLKDSEVAKLVYRDHVQVKHSSRKRLSAELEAIQESCAPLALYDKAGNKLHNLGGPMSKAFAVHLVELCKRNLGLVFSLSKDLVGEHWRDVRASGVSFKRMSESRQLQLDDDSSCAVHPAPCVGADLLNKKFFWFQPVGGNLNHHLIMGEALNQYDFLAQPFEVRAAEFEDGQTYPSCVTVAPSGKTVTCSITHIPFDRLSQSLTVWSNFAIEFAVVPHL